MLEASGVDLTGWQLSGASSISNDGNTIVGWGINPRGLQEAWVAVLSIPVDEAEGYFVAANNNFSVAEDDEDSSEDDNSSTFNSAGISEGKGGAGALSAELLVLLMILLGHMLFRQKSHYRDQNLSN